MPRPNKDRHRPVKLVRIPRRNWGTGEDKFSYTLGVPVEMGAGLPPDVTYYPVLLKDGSVLFKRWDTAQFDRWLAQCALAAEEETADD